MNFLSKTKKSSKKPPFRAFVLLISLIASLTVFSQIGYAQAKLTLADIFTGLRSKKVSLEDRNRLLTEAIKSRGITFAVTSEIEKELQESGAAKQLIEAVKQKSVVVKSIPTPIPVASPTPAPTPIPTPAPPDFSSFQRKADGNFVKGEYDLAVVNYSKAIDLNPKESSIYLSRGLVYYNRKFYDLAISDYGKVIEINPKEMMAYYYRGDSYEKLGDLQKAADDYKKVLELDSTNETAKANVQRLEAELAKNKPKETVVPAATKDEPSRERVTNSESTEPPKTPEFAELGSLIGFAVKIAQPAYPQQARNVYLGGEVIVNITIDEQGTPISVKAVTGPSILRTVSEEAARRSRFKPAMINNQPVKAKGFITFKFKPN